MIWLLLGAVALLALAPLAIASFRPARPLGRAESDLDLYRAQLAELDREREAGRLDAQQHQSATLEVQRRILAAAAAAEAGAPAAAAAAAPPRGGRAAALLAAMVFLLPAVAFGIYMVRGMPDMPSAPYAERQRMAEEQERMLETLRGRLAMMEPTSDAARQGQILLGNAERGRGRIEPAINAYRAALTARFDPELAGDVAELEIERQNPEAAVALLARALGSAPRHPRLRFLSGLAEARAGRPEAARRIWQALLADASPEAPWRPVVEQSLRTLP